MHKHTNTLLDRINIESGFVRFVLFFSYVFFFCDVITHGFIALLPCGTECYLGRHRHWPMLMPSTLKVNPVVKYHKTSSCWPSHCFEASDYHSQIFLLHPSKHFWVLQMFVRKRLAKVKK